MFKFLPFTFEVHLCSLLNTKHVKGNAVIRLTLDSTINLFTVTVKSNNNNPSFTVESGGSTVALEEIIKLPDIYQGEIENRIPGEYLIRLQPTSGEEFEITSEANSTFYIQYGFTIIQEKDECQTYRQPFGCK